MRAKHILPLLAAVVLVLGFGLGSPSVFAQGAGGAAPPPPPPPAWDPPGGTITPPSPTGFSTYTATDKKTGDVYEWNAKVCRWVYKNKPKGPLGGNAGDPTSPPGLPHGAKMNPGSMDSATNAATGDTFTWDDKDGWINDKTKKPLCTPPKAAAVAPGPGGGGIKQQPDWRFSGALGGTLLIPNVMVGWNGTGTGGAINSTFNNVQVMPTLELDVWHPITRSGLSLGASGNLMLPFQGINNKTVSNGTYSGTESYKQGLAGSAYFNVGAPMSSTIDYLSGTPHSYDFSRILNSPQAFWFVGAGLAVDQYKASAVFPMAGDYFSATHTDVVPAFQAGITGKFPMGQSFMSVTGQVQDLLPGGTVTMPFGNAVSYGTAKAGNTVGVTFKAGMPF